MSYSVKEISGAITEVFHSDNGNVPSGTAPITDEEFSIIRHAPHLYKLVSGVVVVNEGLELKEAKSKKIYSVNLQCEQLIVNGFSSSALGVLHAYQSQREDQLNLLGSLAGGTGGPFKCELNGAWQYRAHTAAEIVQVFSDGSAYKLALLQQCEALKVAVAAATNTEELGGIEIDYSSAAQ
ncbi:MAG: hypothetical protein COC04_00875 [Gammaproteobacteria bacterium]|nr:MAG: hypothetical protein COC04_00875 [Gammaproteobacteria bacterium]